MIDGLGHVTNQISRHYQAPPPVAQAVVVIGRRRSRSRASFRSGFWSHGEEVTGCCEFVSNKVLQKDIPRLIQRSEYF